MLVAKCGTMSLDAVTTQIKDEPRLKCVASGPLPKLGLVCDYLEERWPSMDLFGDIF
jgi:hypothetical protein